MADDRSEAALKAWATRRAGGGPEEKPGSVKSREKDVPVKTKLVEKPEAYFKVDKNTKHVSLDTITPVRARESGIRHAEVNMAKALSGKGQKREPISLEDQGDGTYKVMDGNSTFAIAKKQGWKHIPAKVWKKGEWKDPKGGH